jgi:hypothetical protein
VTGKVRRVWPSFNQVSGLMCFKLLVEICTYKLAGDVVVVLVVRRKKALLAEPTTFRSPKVGQQQNSLIHG